METVTFSDPKGFFFEVIKWITPVILFILAYVVNACIQRCKRKKEKSLISEFILSQLDLLQKQVMTQINQNLDCIRRVKSFNEEDLRLYKVTGNQIERIKSISFNDQFEILVIDRLLKKKQKNIDKNKSIKEEFKELFRSIDSHEASLNIIFKNNEDFLRELNVTLKFWNESHIQTIDFLNSLISTQASKDSFFRGFAKIVNDFETNYGINSQNIEIGYTSLAIPLIAHCKKHSYDPRSRFLMRITQKSREAYIQILMLRRNQRESLIESTRLMLGANRTLNSITQVIQDP